MKFIYSAFDKTGKTVASSIEAPTEAEAREALRKQELFVSDFRAAGVSSASGAIKSIRYGVRLKHLATLSRQLHVLVSSGTPLTQALSAVERQCEDKRWKPVLESLRKRVEEGAQLQGRRMAAADHRCSWTRPSVATPWAMWRATRLRAAWRRDITVPMLTDCTSEISA